MKIDSTTLRAVMVSAFFALFIMNVIDWTRRTEKRFFYYPDAGALKTLYLLLNLTAIVLAVLFLARRLPSVYMNVVFCSLFGWLQIYSICRRHQSERQGTP